MFRDAKHIGKIVLTNKQQSSAVESEFPESPSERVRVIASVYNKETAVCNC